jgi:S-(hydroxymethyl)mycothiol dehydrogenase
MPGRGTAVMTAVPRGYSPPVEVRLHDDWTFELVVRLATVPHEVRGVIAAGKGEPVRVETVVVPDPGSGEALVKVQACGVCHTDLHYREGAINDDFPFLLGHEAAGVVEATGPDAVGLEVGDYVVLNWRAVCGDCRACRRVAPWHCFATHSASQTMTLTDGRSLSPALGIGALAERTLVAAGQCTKIDSRARPEAAGLLGCGVMAGFGAAANTARVGRGDTVAVFGCGGVGDAAIAAAALAGARKVIAVDIDAKKLEWAWSFGATDVVDGCGSAKSSPTASVPTCASRRSATPRCSSRRSTPATSPGRSCRWACPDRRSASSCR